MTALESAPPLGAVQDGRGVGFALLSREAEKVELCLFDDTGRREERRHVLGERTGDIWHDYLPGVRSGQLYGYRVYGPYRPKAGLRFNAHKLLLDPFARKIRGPFTWNDAVFGYNPHDPHRDLSFNAADSAPFVPKSVVAQSVPARTDLLDHPRASSVICELHVKGYTELCTLVSKPLRGSFAALAEPAVIDHLVRLGVTAVELMPVQAFISELPLVRRGLVNYWGYNPLAFFALHGGYLANDDAEEFSRAVSAFHGAGIEVILDMVFNHTAESDEAGPTLSLRGIDNRTYYRLERSDARLYVNWTGCGNTLNISDPAVADLVVGCLRHWRKCYGIDGFRFDLAAVLARDGNDGFDGESPFLAMVDADPTLSGVKLIAEPWDGTREGYRLGAFPKGWSEWNDRYRHTVRGFWGRKGGLLGDLAYRVSGSSDVFARAGRGPSASVNFVTAHDGFTLEDVVSYTKKNNWANGEHNRDGEETNDSFNCGAEGPSDDPAVRMLRVRQKRNLLATLMLSRGIPMLRGGDELGQTQGGNNNAYCQDNEIGWLDWSKAGDPERDLSAYIGRLARFRRARPALWGDRFLKGKDGSGQGQQGQDVVWLTSDGRECAETDWQDPALRMLAFMLDGGHLGDGDVEDKARTRLIVVMNAGENSTFTLPKPRSRAWWRVLDTAHASGFPENHRESATAVFVNGRSVVVFEDGEDTKDL